MIADRKYEEAEGAASKARIIDAPALCPATVTREVSPPNAGNTVLRNLSELTTSLTARFVLPEGDKKPN